MNETALAIRKEIEIDAPPERVWPYVATQEGCRRWFCTVAEVYDLVLEPRAGGRYQDHMVVGGTTYRGVGEIVAYDPPRRLVYRYRSRLADGSLTSPNTVSITLSDEHGRTRVVVEETGFDQPAGARMRRFTSTDQGWEAALEDARAILAQELLPDLGHLLIYQSMEIAAPASRIWEFIATPEGRLEMLRAKYPPSHLESDLFEAHEGGRWESSGVSAQTGDRYCQFGRILRYEPPRLLVYTLQEDGWPDATLVTYRLIEYFGRTRVTLTHSGFEKLPPQRHLLTRKAYEIGRYGSLERLRLLVEGHEVPVVHPLSIRKDVVIDAPIDRVWRYIGTQDGSLARHRAENVPEMVEYQDEILEERPGGRYELRGLFYGQPFTIIGQVMAYDPPRVLALSWREQAADGTGWPVDTLVRFRLSEEGGRTRVTVIHHGFEHLPAALRDRALREYEAGRQRGLHVLRTLLEEPGGEERSRGEAWVVRKEVEIHAPPERVWPYVATRDGYVRWSCTVAEVYDVELEERIGGRYREHGISRGMEWTNVGRVIDYSPSRRFAFTFQTLRPDGSVSPEMTVTIRLIDLGGRTRVILEHSGIDRLPVERRDASFRSFDQGWGHALEVLGRLVEQDAQPAAWVVRKGIEIDAPATQVWRVVATQDGLRQWWDAPALVLEERPGGRLDSKGVHEGAPYHHIGQVLAYEPPRRFVMTLREDLAGGGFWPADSVVTITLTEDSGRTRVLVEHDFSRLPDDLRDRMVQAYRRGWTDALMERLRELLTRGAEL